MSFTALSQIFALFLIVSIGPAFIAYLSTKKML